MKIWYNNVIDTDRRVVEVHGDRVRIGRAAFNEIVLDSPYIASEAAVLYRRSSRWELVALGINGVQVGEQRFFNGQRCLIESNQHIRLFPFSLTLDLPRQEQASQRQIRVELDLQLSRLLHQVHLELLNQMELKSPGATNDIDDEYLLKLERNLDEISRSSEEFQKQETGFINHLAGLATRDALLEIATSNDSGKPSALCGDQHWSRLVSAVPEREEELLSAAGYLKGLLEFDSEQSLTERINRIESRFWKNWNAIQKGVHSEFKEYLALRLIKKDIKDIVFGYGPLEDLLRLPTISEIMVVDRDHIYVERNGVLENSGRRFISDSVIESIIQRIVSRVGRRIDKSQPMVDARLIDGSRINAVIPPLAVSGPCLTIRKFPARKMLIDDLVAMNSMTRTVAEFLRAIVLAKKNILVSGGTGSGKTTLLNCLSDFIPDKERIVTVEDTAELQLAREHVVRLETKDSNIEGTGEYTIRDLVRNSLRMRPDRIVVGECRGPEAIDMLQAMNTGHDGSLTTIHANNPIDVTLRLEVLVQMASDLPVSSIRQQIASAIDVVVQLQRLRDGRRCVSHISEITGINPVTGELTLRDLFKLATPDRPGSMAIPSGRLPTFIESLTEQGFLQLDTFYQDSPNIG